MNIKRLAAAGGIGLAMGCAGFLGAANATAGPMDYQCAPCVGDINKDGKNERCGTK